MQIDIAKLEQTYQIPDEEQFEDYTKKAIIALTTGKKPSKDRTLTIVGGQTGAGKTRLVKVALNELADNAVVVDFVELMALHPSYKEVAQKYPEIAYRILQSDEDKLERIILDFLRKKGYNTVCEGTLRRTEKFIRIIEKFQLSGYVSKMKTLAVPKLESYGSTFERYAIALLSNSLPRWVEKYGHDDSYTGVITTTQELIDRGLISDISVYVRGKSDPQKIYSTEERQFPNAIEAISYGRAIKRKKALEDFELKYTFVVDVLSSRQPELLSRLNDWKELYEQEKQYFKFLDAAEMSE